MATIHIDFGNKIGKLSKCTLSVSHPSFEVYLINPDNLLAPTEFNPKDFTLNANDIALIKNY